MTYYMLQRLVELRVVVTTARVDLNFPVELTSSNWLPMKKVVKILQIYEKATHEASGSYTTAAVVIPVVNSNMRSLEIGDSDTGVMKMKREMLRSLRAQYRQIESNEFYAIATLLVPRFKQKVFCCSSSAALAKQMLIAAHERLEDVDEESPTTATKRARVERDDDSTAAAKKKSSLL